MGNQIDYNQNNEDEISLIDLFAVLIRYRKLIIIGTLTITVLAGLYLFVLPIVVPSLSKAQSSITYNIGINELPSSLSLDLAAGNRIILNLAMAELKNTQLFSSLYRENPFFSDELPETVAAYNKMIIDFFEKNIEISDSSDSSIELTLQIPSRNLNKADEFIQNYISKTNEAILSYIIPQIQQIKNSSEAALAATTAQSSFVDSSKQNLQRLVFDAQEYLKGNTPPLFLHGAAFEIPVAQGRVTKLIIVAFAAFFVTIFIAFVLNAVSNIKADPQASKVISDAWKAGK